MRTRAEVTEFVMRATAKRTAIYLPLISPTLDYREIAEHINAALHEIHFYLYAPSNARHDMCICFMARRFGRPALQL